MEYSAKYVLDTSKLKKNTLALDDKMKKALTMYANTKAAQLRGYMRTNRPWTDRTGEAKRRLSADVESKDDDIVITLSHGVSYGIWLELSNEKKYAIIAPTIRIKSGEVMKGCQKLLDRLGR